MVTLYVLYVTCSWAHGSKHKLRMPGRKAESSDSSPSRAPAHSLLRLHIKQESKFCSKNVKNPKPH